MITFQEFLTELPKIDNIRNDIIQASIQAGIQATKTPDDPYDYWEYAAYKLTKSASKRYDFKKIGDGFYAVVLQHSNYPFVLKIWRPDQGYDHWLRFVAANQSNPYVPMLRGRPVNIGKTGIKAVRMEMLTPVSTSEFNKFILSLESDNIRDPHLKQIRGYIDVSPHYVDMHPGNIMKRANNQIVVTDPLS
jgi:hypothetical protein